MSYKLQLVIAMLIFGSVGVVVKTIDMAPGFVSLTRSVLGCAFIIAVQLARRKKADFAAIRKNAPTLIISGLSLGANWICLFESYNHTTVSTASLCNYMAPIIVIIISPFILRERNTAVKLISIFIAFIGIIPVSGILTQDKARPDNYIGVILALSAAVFYASLVICNKKITDISASDRTTVQLGSAGALLLVYTCIFEKPDFSEITAKKAVLLVVAGIVHTGIVYILYLSSVEKLAAATSSVLSYIDPVSSLVFAAVILGEQMDEYQIIGAVMIISALLLPELIGLRKNGLSTKK